MDEVGSRVRALELLVHALIKTLEKEGIILPEELRVSVDALKKKDGD